MSRFIVNKPVNWQLCIKGKQKRYFERSFKKYMNPCAYLSKWSPYAPGYIGKVEFVFSETKVQQSASELFVVVIFYGHLSEVLSFE